MSLDLRRWWLAICGEPAIEERSSYFKIITTTHCKANATYFAPLSPAGLGATRCSRDCGRWSSPCRRPRIHHRLENRLVVHVEGLRERRNCSQLEAKARVKNASLLPPTIV